MSKNIAKVDKLLDTFDTWVVRTNEVVEAINTEVITANTSLGVTGTTSVPLNASLIGSFTANNLYAANTIQLGTSFSANTSKLVIGSVGVQANNTVGVSGQVLTSNGTGVYWATVSGSGTVTEVKSGNGMNAGSITSAGTISVKAGTGIVVDATGVSVNTAWLADAGAGNASQLQGRTWDSPLAIGSTLANSGSFTTVSATTSYSIGSNVLINNDTIRTAGNVDATTPVGTTTGGFRLRARTGDSIAYIQTTNNAGTVEWNNIAITPSVWNFSSDMKIQGSIDVGYRNIPQIAAGSNVTIATSTGAGKHFYKTVSSDITLSVPDNSTDACVIGTTITFINGSATGNLIINQLGSTVIQLAGSQITGNRTISPGGLGTLIKIEANKWIMSGVGVA